MTRESVKEFASKIVENRGDWTFGEYRAVHAKSDTNIWIANGAFSLTVNNLSLPYRYRKIIWNAVIEAVITKSLD